MLKHCENQVTQTQKNKEEYELLKEIEEINIIDDLHLKRSKAIAEIITKHIPESPQMNAMDYGAGSGMLSILLSKKFADITLVDNNPDSMKMMKDGLSKLHIDNLHPLLWDMEQTTYKKDEFDCIFTQMVLHHIADTDTVLHNFSQSLKPGGYLAIADLYTEDGSFHGEEFTGHNGFDPYKMKLKLEEMGFMNITSEQCFTMTRERNNRTIEYPIFLLIAQKKK